MQADYQTAVQLLNTIQRAEWAVLSVSCACAELQQPLNRFYAKERIQCVPQLHEGCKSSICSASMSGWRRTCDEFGEGGGGGKRAQAHGYIQDHGWSHL